MDKLCIACSAELHPAFHGLQKRETDTLCKIKGSWYHGSWSQGLCAVGKSLGGQGRVRLMAGESAAVGLYTWIIDMYIDCAPLNTILQNHALGWGWWQTWPAGLCHPALFQFWLLS